MMCVRALTKPGTVVAKNMSTAAKQIIVLIVEMTVNVKQSALNVGFMAIYRTTAHNWKNA